MLESWTERQRAICAKYAAEPMSVSPGEKLGIARNVRSGVLPIHGVRVAPERGTCGWYIWAGAESKDPDFFEALHIRHLEEWCASAMPYLLLPPGWRFLVADGYEDVWFDPSVDTSPTK